MTIRWITSLLGTAAFNAVQNTRDIEVIDVRDLVDKAGNDSRAILEKFIKGLILSHKVSALSFVVTMECLGVMP